ncbi:MAG TPA: ribosome silencing factor [Clostridia bacterium]|nr:ribosome silencing factor [Clostridia bacterium]
MLSAAEGAVLAAREAVERKAKDVVVIDLRNLSPVTDYFVICSGDSDIQVQSIARHLKEKLKGAGLDLLRMEGFQDAQWVLMDFGDVVVHVFYQEARAFYSLERLWGDAPRVNYSQDSII